MKISLYNYMYNRKNADLCGHNLYNSVTMKYLIFFLLLLSVTLFSCSSSYSTEMAQINEKADKQAITDSTIVFDIKSITVDTMLVSNLIENIHYIKLKEPDDYKLGGILYKFMVVDSLIYISDYDGNLLCFTLDGEFHHNATFKGHGHGEVSQMADFFVDENYLYLLDYGQSAILKYDHRGKFLSQSKLPFRATHFALLHDKFLFRLAPFSLNNDSQQWLLAVTDQEFNVLYNYYEYLEEDRPSSRMPYFRGEYFAPVNLRSIYKFQDDCSLSSMAYYLNFDCPYYDSGRLPKSDFYKELAENQIYYTTACPFTADNYILQYFFTAPKVEGLFVCNTENNKAIFVKTFLEDTHRSIGFDFFSVKYYDAKSGLLFANSRSLNKAYCDKETIASAESYLDKDVQPFLIREDGEDDSPLIMCFSLKKDIL